MEEFKERDDETIYIRATIFVERDSQKGIIIGAKGSLLKKIGQQARADLEKLLYCKVYLDLWVKVKADWRNQEKSLRQFGYKEWWLINADPTFSSILQLLLILLMVFLNGFFVVAEYDHKTGWQEYLLPAIQSGF